MYALYYNQVFQTSQLVDDLLGEVHSLKRQLGEVQGSVEKRLDNLDSQVHNHVHVHILQI